MKDLKKKEELDEALNLIRGLINKYNGKEKSSMINSHLLYDIRQVITSLQSNSNEQTVEREFVCKDCRVINTISQPLTVDKESKALDVDASLQTLIDDYCVGDMTNTAFIEKIKKLLQQFKPTIVSEEEIIDDLIDSVHDAIDLETFKIDYTYLKQLFRLVLKKNKN